MRTYDRRADETCGLAVRWQRGGASVAGPIPLERRGRWCTGRRCAWRTSALLRVPPTSCADRLFRTAQSRIPFVGRESDSGDRAPQTIELIDHPRASRRFRRRAGVLGDEISPRKAAWVWWHLIITRQVPFNNSIGLLTNTLRPFHRWDLRELLATSIHDDFRSLSDGGRSASEKGLICRMRLARRWRKRRCTQDESV